METLTKKRIKGPFVLEKKGVYEIKVPEFISIIGNDLGKLTNEFYGPLRFAIGRINRFQQENQIVCKCGSSKIHFTMELAVKTVDKKQDIFLTSEIMCEICGHSIEVQKNVGHDRPCSSQYWEEKIRQRMLGNLP